MQNPHPRFNYQRICSNVHPSGKKRGRDRRVLLNRVDYRRHTNSDHRVLDARFKLDRMYGTFSTKKKSKLERFAVERLCGPKNVREAYRESVSDVLDTGFGS